MTHSVLSAAEHLPTDRTLGFYLDMRKEDSALAYFIFEASEGLCAYSTAPHQVGDTQRTLEVWVPPGQLPEFLSLVRSWEQRRASDGASWCCCRAVFSSWKKPV